MRRSQQAKRRPNRLTDLVLEDVSRLSKVAAEAAKAGDFALSSYVNATIIEISQSTRVRLPREVKLSMCKNCRVSLIPGVTLSVRLRSAGSQTYIVRRCLVCGYIHRIYLMSCHLSSKGQPPSHKASTPHL